MWASLFYKKRMESLLFFLLCSVLCSGIHGATLDELLALTNKFEQNKNLIFINDDIKADKQLQEELPLLSFSDSQLSQTSYLTHQNQTYLLNSVNNQSDSRVLNYNDLLINQVDFGKQKNIPMPSLWDVLLVSISVILSYNFAVKFKERSKGCE